MIETKKKNVGLFGLWSLWSLLVFLIILSVSAFVFYVGQWLPGLVVLLIGLLWAIFSFRIVRPAFSGLVLRFGSRVIISETIQYFRIVDGQKQDIPTEEFNAPTFDSEASDIRKEVISIEYLTKKEGWTIVFPIIINIVEISLRQHREEINKKETGEDDEAYLNRAESIATAEGINIFPKIFYSYKIVNPGKVFELGGGIDKNGDSPFLVEMLHDLVIGGTRGVLAKMELTKILSRETEDENGKAMPVGEKIRADIISTPNFSRLGAEILIIRIEDIKFKKDAQDVLDALEKVKKEKLSRESQIVEADAKLEVQKKNAEAIVVAAEANLTKAKKEAAGFNAAIAAFVGKTVDEKTTSEEGKAYAQFQIGLAIAKSLETGTKVIIPATDASKTLAELVNVFGATKS